MEELNGDAQRKSSGVAQGSVSFYRQKLTPHLGAEVFKPHPRRLIWYGFCVSGAFLSYLAIVSLPIGWPVKLMLAIVIGICNGLLAFICHEIGHGTVIRNQKLQDFLIFLGAIPFLISPTFWKFWHNRLHHGKTQQLIKDPDAFPNLRIYKASKFMKFMFPYTPGSGHKRSYFYFFFWFSFHNFIAQTYLRFRNAIFDSLDHRRVNIEFGFECVILAGLLIYAGPANWLWVFLIPLAIQNYIVMSYIATNHNMSPLTHENDPLANSLSVSNSPIFEFLTLNFGYHVEHHIFPKVNGHHAKAIHKALVLNFPERYKIMPKWTAIRALYSTPRIYKNSHELIHPETMGVHPTIGHGLQMTQAKCAAVAGSVTASTAATNELGI